MWLAWYESASATGIYLTRITPLSGAVTGCRGPVPEPYGFAVRDGRAVLTARRRDKRSTELIRVRLDGPGDRDQPPHAARTRPWPGP
ncbi:hypothetical protein [Streptomyces sp. MUM 203J]|uniref:hypothetical protein n=1 Tax=Streptomyces sp. MUM 203J TaxID=2791990 RepID=UPI001F03C0D6|nr:hypothetical protein [Streptomyces sp. MUM 203J]